MLVPLGPAPGREVVEAAEIGARRLVDRFRISLPLTTRLSLDFRKSLVIISEMCQPLFKVRYPQYVHTFSPHVELDDASYTNIDDPEEALILLLEFLLVENLHSKDAVLGRSPVSAFSMYPLTPNDFSYMSKLSFQYGLRVFLITPVVLVCSPFTVATAKGSGKPCGGQLLLFPPRCTCLTEHITLVQAVCSNDCTVLGASTCRAQCLVDSLVTRRFG